MDVRNGDVTAHSFPCQNDAGSGLNLKQNFKKKCQEDSVCPVYAYGSIIVVCTMSPVWYGIKYCWYTIIVPIVDLGEYAKLAK